MDEKLTFALIRSRRKTVSIEVTRALDIVVRAPERTPLREIEKFVSARSQWIDAARDKQRLRGAMFPEPTPDEASALSALAKRILPGRVEHFARIMRLSPKSVRITGAKTRFGSCSPSNGICFSYRLMRYAPEAVDYVVVHELAHIVHKNHGQAFYRLVESVLPDWKTRRRMLREEGAPREREPGAPPPRE